MLRRATAAALVVLVPLASGAFASAQAPTAAVQHQLKAAKKKAPPKPAAIMEEDKTVEKWPLRRCK